MIQRFLGNRLVTMIATVLGLAGATYAATVTRQVYVTFDGTLSGTAYTLGAGEIDNSFTFAGSGGVTISGGIADVPGDVAGNSGFLFSGTDLVTEQMLGSLRTTNWISEALFKPDVLAAQQPTNPQPANHILDIQGDTFVRYDGFGRSPKVFDSGYWDGSNEIINVAAEPPLDSFSHVALVWDAANTKLEAFLNGVSIGVADQGAFDVSSPSVGYGFFARFLNRAVDGKLDAVAFSTYSGTFAGASDFQLSVIPEPSTMMVLAIALGGFAWFRNQK